MSKTLPERRVSKSKFSMYLRTGCDRELYLSLFSNNPDALSAAGIPVPLKSRPGVQFITKSGTEFEYEQFDILINALPTYVAHKSAGRTGIDLGSVLATRTAPTIILQPTVEPNDYKGFALGQLGVSANDIAIIPQLSGSVRKFFTEDLPRVIALGDSRGWNAVEYHVNPRCGSCDWLGNRSWLSDKERVFFDKKPDDYCYIGAESSDHLCKMPSLSKGATQILHKGGHPQVGKLVGIDPTAPVLRNHTMLKKDRVQIGRRAESITTNTVTVDTNRKVGGLARNPGAEFDIIVNFDAGSGLLTGIATRGTLFAPFGFKFPNDEGLGTGLKPLGEAAFVVNKDNLLAEWAALSGFIANLGGWIEDAEKVFKDQGMGPLRTQICFWELRQYEELCNAFGRHLLRVLSLGPKAQRALAWIFPPGDLLEKTEQICPNIVFIKDVLTASVHLPQRFAVTLLGAADLYHHQRLTPRKLDSYYVEPLGNGIPRERIFEIWKSPTGTVRMFGQVVSVIDAAERYGSALKAHAWAMSSIAARLRDDLKPCLTGKAPKLDMAIPSGLTGVAYDSKLWDRWETVSAAVEKADGISSMIARAEVLEASYQAIVLENLTKSLGGHRYEFAVSADSTEAKIEENDQLTLGIVSMPGFPMMSAYNLVGLDDYSPMHKVIMVKIEEFDRAAGRIVVRLWSDWQGYDNAFNAVMAAGIIPIGKEPLYLLTRMPFDDSKETTEILRAIGEPACATPAPEALTAMGASASKKVTKGTGLNPPIARALWDAGSLAAAQTRTEQQVQQLVTFATTANKHELNPSQVSAVRECFSRQLAIIWGPPGTGKVVGISGRLKGRDEQEGPFADRRSFIRGRPPSCRPSEDKCL